MRFALYLSGAVFASATPSPTDVLIFEDHFDTLNLSIWKHELTLSGEGNWEFELYANNRSVSFVRNGSLFIAPKYTNDSIGDAGLMNADFNIWGGSPADYCTNPGFFGCERQGGGGGNIVNPCVFRHIE